MGINLTAADTIVVYDHDWNPSNDAQAMDRAHHLGQTHQVTVHRLITKGTIDERIVQPARVKKDVRTSAHQRFNLFPNVLDRSKISSSATNHSGMSRSRARSYLYCPSMTTSLRNLKSRTPMERQRSTASQRTRTRRTRSCATCGPKKATSSLDTAVWLVATAPVVVSVCNDDDATRGKKRRGGKAGTASGKNLTH